MMVDYSMLTFPQLADRGLAAARQYGDVAPAAPHALHMPSHIYAAAGTG
jgi:hypothetical protein